MAIFLDNSQSQQFCVQFAFCSSTLRTYLMFYIFFDLVFLLPFFNFVTSDLCLGSFPDFFGPFLLYFNSHRDPFHLNRLFWELVFGSTIISTKFTQVIIFLAVSQMMFLDFLFHLLFLTFALDFFWIVLYLFQQPSCFFSSQPIFFHLNFN